MTGAGVGWTRLAPAESEGIPSGKDTKRLNEERTFQDSGYSPAAC